MIPSTLQDSELIERLRLIDDPEIGINIVDLGLVYSLEHDNAGNVRVALMPTTPSCPVQAQFLDAARQLLGEVAGVKSVDAFTVLDPRWTPDRISEEGKVQLRFR